MKTQRIIAAIGGLALTLLAAQTQAAEIKVLSSTAMKTALEELGPQFEKATGNKVAFTIGPAAVLKKQIDQGAVFDVAILTTHHRQPCRRRQGRYDAHGHRACGDRRCNSEGRPEARYQHGGGLQAGAPQCQICRPFGSRC